MTNGPLMITAPLGISMEGPLGSGTSGGLPCEESHSGSGHHSLPWGLWRMTNGPSTITAPVRISMEGRWVRGISGGGRTVFLDVTSPPYEMFGL